MTSSALTHSPKPVDSGVELRVVFEDDYVSLNEVMQILDGIDEALVLVQDGVLQFAPNAGYGDEHIADDARRRLRASRRQSLVIVGATTGSVVLQAFAVAIAIGLLKITVAESIKEGWKRSEQHEAIVDFVSTVLTDVFRSPTRLAESLQKWFVHRMPRVRVREDAETSSVEVRVQSRKAKPGGPPTAV